MNTYKEFPFNFSKFIFYCLRPYRRQCYGLVLFTVYLGLFVSLEPLSLKLIIDNVLKIDKEGADLGKYFLFFIGIRLIFSISAFWIDYLLAYIHPRVKTDIALNLFNNLLYHTEQFYQEELGGSLASKIAALQEAIKNILDTSRRIFCVLCEIFFACIFTSFIASRYVLLILSWTIVFVFIGSFLSSRFTHLSYQLSENNNLAVGRIVDSLSNIFTVKIFSHYPYENKYVSQYLEKVEEKDKLFRLFQAKSWVVLDLLCLILSLGMMVFLISLMKKMNITAGDFAFVVMLTSSLSGTIFNILEHLEGFIKSIGAGKECLSIFSKKLEIKEIQFKNPLVVKKGDIEFSKVEFSYDSQRVFNNLNIKINKGETVGLVGVSGSGKSTFVKLILGLLSPQKGRICIDGMDLEEVSPDSLRKSVSFINQDPVLFHRTIKENILYGNIQATDKEIVLAAQKAHIHKFIETLPHGYHTMVGEKGIKLSGGQRQRIAIARAFLKKTKILIMDEATSSLDIITEKEIQKSLNLLTINKTTLIIAHRLSTISTLKRILVFDNGKIVADGNPKELLKTNSLYRKLWTHSINGLLPNTLQGQ